MASLKLYSDGTTEFNGSYVTHTDINIDGDDEVTTFIDASLHEVETILNNSVDLGQEGAVFYANDGSGSIIDSTISQNTEILVFEMDDYQAIFDTTNTIAMEVDFSDDLYSETEDLTWVNETLITNIDDTSIYEAIELAYDVSTVNETDLIADLKTELLNEEAGSYLAQNLFLGLEQTTSLFGSNTSSRFSWDGNDLRARDTFNAIFGYEVSDNGSDYLSGDYEENISLDDILSGSTKNDGIWGGFGDDIIFAQDNDGNYSNIGNYTIVVEDNDNELSKTIGITSSGVDFLFGNEGNDLLYGGKGDGVISGGDGADVIYENSYEEDENHIFGGEGIDTFIITATTTSEESTDTDEFPWEESLVDVISGGIFGVLKSATSGGLKVAVPVLEQVFTLGKDLLSYYVFGAETSSSAKPTSEATKTIK